MKSTKELSVLIIKKAILFFIFNNRTKFLWHNYYAYKFVKQKLAVFNMDYMEI